MFGAELVEDVGGVEAGVVAELAGNDLQGFGVSADQQLLFAWNGPGIVPQVFGKFHLDGAATGNDRVVLENKGKGFCSVKSRKSSMWCQGDAETPGLGEFRALAASETGQEP